MDLSIYMDMININTITYRGIVCIDTFPLELVWGKSYTVLECNNCLEYATFKNVLVGLCKNCALYSYNGKYGNGFYKYPYSDISNDEFSYCFGAIHPLHILSIKGIEYPQIAINYSDTYSIYNLSLSSKNELSLLLKPPFNIYGLSNFQHYYNCDIEVLHMIIDKIKEHKLTFDIWSNKYYTDCLTIEKFYKVSAEDYKIQNDIENKNGENGENDDNHGDSKPKYPCSYCNIYKIKTELKKCSKCYDVRYCSIACQIRDWNAEHKTNCEQGQGQGQGQDLENTARKESDEGEQDSDTSSCTSYDKRYDENYDDYDYEN